MPRSSFSLSLCQVVEMFGAGTAAIVSPIKGINFEGKELVIPLNKKDPEAMSGDIAARMARALMDIQVFCFLCVCRANQAALCVCGWVWVGLGVTG